MADRRQNSKHGDIRNANGLPAIFVGSKTGQDDAPFFVKVGNEERRMRWAEWDALTAWTGSRPPKMSKTNKQARRKLILGSRSPARKLRDHAL